MIWLILSIMSIIIISLIRIRLLRQIFEHTQKRTFLITSAISSIGVFIITLLYYMKQVYQLSDQQYIYLYGTISVVIGLFYFQRQRFSWWISQLWLWIGLAFLWWLSGLYSIAALWEETFKWIYIKKFVIWLLWEIILLGIISGIAFGWTENLVYIIQNIIKETPNNEIISLIQQRWIIPLIVHIGSLCLSIFIGFSLKTKTYPIIARWVAISTGIGSHYLFNLSQNYQIILWSTILIIGYLIIISYSLFRSDFLYIPPQQIENT